MTDTSSLLPFSGKKAPFFPLFSFKFYIESFLCVKHYGNDWGKKLLAAFLKESAFTALEFRIFCQGKQMPCRGWGWCLWAEGGLRDKRMFLHGSSGSWGSAGLEASSASLLLGVPGSQTTFHIRMCTTQTWLTGRTQKQPTQEPGKQKLIVSGRLRIKNWLQFWIPPNSDIQIWNL